MTRYEYLENEANKCLIMAGTEDKNLKKFYLNANKGFMKKLQNLTIEEAFEIIS